MLAKRVSRVGIEMGRYEHVPGEGSNIDALIRFTKQLLKERRTWLPCQKANNRSSYT
jgi:hypothetical protein